MSGPPWNYLRVCVVNGFALITVTQVAIMGKIKYEKKLGDNGGGRMPPIHCLHVEGGEGGNVDY